MRLVALLAVTAIISIHSAKKSQGASLLSFQQHPHDRNDLDLVLLQLLSRRHPPDRMPCRPE